MSNNYAKGLLPVCCLGFLVGGILILRPGYFATASGLATLIGAEVLLAVACNFQKAFFPAVLVCFLIAGTALPFRNELLQARWVILGIGAVLGIAVSLRTHLQRFNVFHLVALFCVLSAFVSSLVSAYPGESRLKAISLFLLFVYVATGARTSVTRDAERLFRSLLRGAEALLIATAVLYLGFRWEFLGNPNSLGAVMAVMILPLLLWGYLTANSRRERLRIGVELLVALLLLFSSFARASIAASVISCILVCWTAREFRLLTKGIVAAGILAFCVVLFVPRHAEAPKWDKNESITTVFLYKGKQEDGFLGSRRGVWQKTWDVIREKPWFGSGFGTSHVDRDMTRLEYAQHHFDSWVIREHGNSYLAIAEWTGLLGVVPFFALVVLVGSNAVKILIFVRRTHHLSSPALPAAAIAISGLVHATFEDWMFAVGYYVCVFFWANAFILNDLVPAPLVTYSPAPIMASDNLPHGVAATAQ